MSRRTSNTADATLSVKPHSCDGDAREVIQLIKAEGRKAIPIPGDLREESFCKDLVTKTFAALDGLDVIVSNAGRQQQCEDILQLTTEAFDATIEDQYLCCLLDHQGHAPAFAATLARSIRYAVRDSLQN